MFQGVARLGQSSELGSGSEQAIGPRLNPRRHPHIVGSETTSKRSWWRAARGPSSPRRVGVAEVVAPMER